MARYNFLVCSDSNVLEKEHDFLINILLQMLTLTLLLVSAVCSTQIDLDLVEDEERTLGGLALDAGVSAQQKAITYKSAGK